MDGLVCVVTGATSGIGLETARALAGKSAHVVLTARSKEKGQAAVDAIRASHPHASVEVELLDLADLSTVRHAGRAIRQRHDRIAVLVNNAGVYQTERTETVDGFESTFGVNHLGHFLFTHLLLPSLVEGPTARVVNVSSEAHRGSDGLFFNDLQWSTRRFSGFRAYADSKLANLLFTRSLSKRFDPAQLVAHAVHPGTVSTGLFDGDRPMWFRLGMKVVRPFLTDASAGAATSVFVATDHKVGQMTGGYFAKARVKTPTRAGRDDLVAGQLWDLSAELLDIEA